MERLRIEARASMVILSGGPDAELPPETEESEAGAVVVPGPEAIFVSGRVEFDAPTLIRIGDAAEVGDLVLAYTGEIATPDRTFQILDTELEVLGQVQVPTDQTSLSIYVTDLQEPDEILVVLR